MNIKFTNIEFNNFLSFEHASLVLDVPGYSFITGKNNCKDDLAYSNGSGKSTIFEALSWGITGETIRGTKEVKRISAAEKDICYVDLQFIIDNNQYRIYRQSSPSKLAFYVNDKDVSGKGIRDTETIIKDYLPDLTSSLLGSVVVLGQGLPMRFSNNSPSGRKDVLEKLSKSDFMIQDLKVRISDRKKVIEDKIRNTENNLITCTTKKNIYEQSLIENFNKLKNFGNSDELKSKLELINEQIKNINAILPLKQDEEKKISNMLSTLISKKSAIIENQNSEIDKIKQPYDEELNTLTLEKVQLSAELDSLYKEIRKLKNVKDVCPTCGQKLPNVEIIDTTELENKSVELSNKVNEITNKLTEVSNNKAHAINNVKNLVVNELQAVQKDVDDFTKKQNDTKEYISMITSQLNNYKNQKIKLESDIEHFESNKKSIEDSLVTTQKYIDEVDNEILYINNEKENLQKHYDVIQKMNTVITRDFRGYLLTSVIEFINKKAKEYSMEVFETDKIDFCLDGNNINISYNEKDYYNLSGGERQKIDLIVQFSIRDMLCKYLNFSSNVLVLDEITDFLDVEGSNKIVNLITNRLRDVESIYIISHHTELNIPYDNEIIVIKDANGISSLK